MQKDFIIVLAWPEGMVFGANAWYDKIFASNNKYRAGHSAVVLIESKTGKTEYFDFGRYHTPKGFGRVRDKETDPDLTLPEAIILEKKINNIDDILLAIAKMKSTHGEGKLYASIISGINFQKGFRYAKKIQSEGMLPYGPFVISGTNCSRFSAMVIRKSNPGTLKKIRLRFPFCISPSPKRNVSIANHKYYLIDKGPPKEIIKTKLESYFTSIEIWKKKNQITLIKKHS